MISLESYKNLGLPVSVSGVISPDLYTSPLSLEAVMILVYKQIWKRITDFPDYEVSNYGMVKSYKCWRGKGPKILKPGWSGDKHSKYLAVWLSNKKTKSKRVHHLVLEAFKGPRPEGMQACHNNGKKWDNSVWNVRWDTHQNNEADKIKHGTLIKGEMHYSSKLKEKQIPMIFEMSKEGVFLKDIASHFGVSHVAIYKVLHRKSWKHV